MMILLKPIYYKKPKGTPVPFQRLIGNPTIKHSSNFHRRFMVAKLIHNLANTNHQNNLYHGTSNLCPGCHSTVETFEHVIICPFQPAQKCRDGNLNALLQNLTSHGIPSKILTLFFMVSLVGSIKPHRHILQSMGLSIPSILY